MSDAGYVALAASAESQIEIKRSRFLTYLVPVTSEDDAREAIAAIRRAHPAARHHCTAFVVAGRDSASLALARSNDDGEPSGTAGAPMLEVLTSFGEEGVSDTLAVVVRYFGGVLLGAGGLARAYSSAVATALAGAPLVRRSPREVLAATLDYSAAHLLAAEAARSGWSVEQTYGAAVEVELAVPPGEVAQAHSRLAALSGGAAHPVSLGIRWVDCEI